MNAVTGQNLAVVSEVKGTTTDPVLKSMELLPLGPVVMMDTPGIDDEGELGALRIKKSYQALNKTDLGGTGDRRHCGGAAPMRRCWKPSAEKRFPGSWFSIKQSFCRRKPGKRREKRSVSVCI